MDYETIVPQNLAQIRARIGDAALRAGRDPEAVRLVAVSKMFPVPAVMTAWRAGQREFGENRPREGAEKATMVAAMMDEAQPIWHMIGHVQRRNTRWVVRRFNYVHSVDRLKLAQTMSRMIGDRDLPEMPVLLECNVSGEASKHGYDAAGWMDDADVREAFFAEVEAVLALDGLRVEGLMTMAPIAEDPEAVRPVFASLRSLRDALSERFPDVSWQHLSMGMTDDFEVAVEEGSTMVRVGRGVFGPRP
jgi:PLP dependent protein